MEIRFPFLSPKESSHSRLHSPRFRSPFLAKKVECGSTLFADTSRLSIWPILFDAGISSVETAFCMSLAISSTTLPALQVIFYELFLFSHAPVSRLLHNSLIQASSTLRRVTSFQGLFLSLEKSLGTRLYCVFTLKRASNVFRLLCSEEIQKRNNQLWFWTCIWRKIGQRNLLIITTASFSKLTVHFFLCFPSTRKRKTGVLKFPRFEKHFRKALFSWRISVDGS